MDITLDYRGDKTFEVHTLNDSFVLDCKRITPVEYFVSGLLGCTGIDLVMMAQKDGFEVRHYTVRGEVERKTTPPMKLASVHIVYRFDGDCEPIKAKRYILASLESYCTTVNSVRDSVNVYYTIEYNGEKIAEREAILSGQGSSEVVLEDGFGAACGS